MTKLLFRLVIGGLFALFGLFSYYGNTDVNPVTGEKQRVQLSPQQEVVLGLQAREEMAAQHGGLFPDPTLQQYVDAVGERLVQRTSVRNSPYRFEFHLLRDPQTINAFALPGGQVFLTAALLARLGDESQLAGVLGHEIGHVIGRHGAEHMAKQQLGVTLVNAVGVAASDEYGSGRGAAAVAQAVNQLVGLNYGRDDELESDRLGLDFIVQAGYDPNGIVGLMEVLGSTRSGGEPPEFFSTHPNPSNRLGILQDLIQDAFPNGVPSNLEDGQARFSQIVGARLR
ncbi:MAG: M48 family metalloprotease [Synechococcales cyanobacterium RU_4_20]|nr:M48 family metalloprotease [Synechococcales cyanobacterium RU_4_20]NJR71485.1 M48 family metalloprotease [Synechococcales cyanobacterium CRU_2_2]